MTKPLIAVIDTETDPFKNNRIPKPFCVEFYCEKTSIQFWGDNCMDKLANYCEQLPDEYMIYAHNGGKFDFHFMHEYLDNPVKIINSRIVSAAYFHHTVRDSYAIIPIPLRDYEKEQFDYSNMERNKREKYKKEILEYLHSDCIHLFNLVSAFVDRFGTKLTVGSTAIKELRKRHTFERMGEEMDAVFRPYYFGGRVQCFRGGILKGPWKAYDVNSSYPKSMRDFDHPLNGSFIQSDEIPENPDAMYFMHFTGTNNGALPVKTKDGLDFTIESGEFFACSHEIKIALKYGLITIEKVHSCYEATETIRFERFVDEFYAEKVASKKAGDKLNELFAKFMLNSAYGKFGQNPANFEDYKIIRDFGNDTALRADGYFIRNEFPSFELWAKPTEILPHSFYDVSIAASITSASRSILLEGLQQAVNPIYCDTDSIICKSFNGEVSSSTLGAWKFEKQTEFAAIAGKKLYAMYDSDNPKAMKLASKGTILELKDIIELCRGGEIIHHNEAPTFSLNKPAHFISRKIAATIDLNPELADI